MLNDLLRALQDRSVLENIQLGHQTNLIELEEAGCEFNKSATETLNEVDISSSSPDIDASSKHDIENKKPTAAELRTEGLIDSTRGEILSIRSSLSRSSTFDTSVIRD